MIIQKNSWTLLTQQQWISWRKKENLSLREAGILFQVSGELVRQWEIYKSYPSEATQKEMLLYIENKKQPSERNTKIASNEQLKNYFETNQRLSTLAISKLCEISITKAKQWINGDLIFNNKVDITKIKENVESFLRGERDHLAPGRNQWTLLSPEELKQFRKTKFTNLDLIITKINISKPSYYNWEAGKYAPNLETQQKLRQLIDDTQEISNGNC